MLRVAHAWRVLPRRGGMAWATYVPVRGVRTPSKHRLAAIAASKARASGAPAPSPSPKPGPASRRAAPLSRPGELPPLTFDSPTAPNDQQRMFSAPPLSPALVDRVHALLGEQAKPTTPQAHSLAYFFQGSSSKHTILAAETGSGKTLAYLLPVLQALHTSRSATEHADLARVRAGHAPRILPRALVLAPTHELARQISDVAKALCHDASHKLRVACSSKPAYAAHLYQDVAQLAARAEDPMDVPGAPISPDVLVSTPSFLNEYSERLLAWDNVQALVIDEADTLLDMGFRPATQRLMDDMPASAQHMYVTATIPQSMRTFLEERYKDLHILASPHLHRLPPRLKAMFVDPGGNKELAVLKEIFRVFTAPGCDKDQILIFRDKRRSVEQLSQYLAARRVDHVALTGEADDRRTRTSKALYPFLARPTSYLEEADPPADAPRVLLTTSLLSRGLDFGPFVRHVFLPDAGRHTARSVHAANNNALELLHRAGRSARAGRAGTVVVFDKESAPGKTKVLINHRGQKKGIVRGQMALLVDALQRKKKRRAS
ncbi:RNA helicase [Malassezia equina]|uniref:ATP-dependent RNA helicase n=1 Tax=Malassezia equina TaxID=1381935 RepID=A0AAF0IZH9_9BASI|nr:RNA helicase [Malassezia equina]